MELLREALQAPPLTLALVTLLGLVIASVLFLRKYRRPGVDFDQQWVERMNAHAQRSHQLAGNLGTLNLKHDALRRDFEAHVQRAEPLIPRFMAVEGRVQQIDQRLRDDIDELKAEAREARREQQETALVVARIAGKLGVEE